MVLYSFSVFSPEVTSLYSSWDPSRGIDKLGEGDSTLTKIWKEKHLEMICSNDLKLAKRGMTIIDGLWEKNTTYGSWFTLRIDTKLDLLNQVNDVSTLGFTSTSSITNPQYNNVNTSHDCDMTNMKSYEGLWPCSSTNHNKVILLEISVGIEEWTLLRDALLSLNL